jgi:hypothetical protein
MLLFFSCINSVNPSLPSVRPSPLDNLRKRPNVTFRRVSNFKQLGLTDSPGIPEGPKVFRCSSSNSGRLTKS